MKPGNLCRDQVTKESCAADGGSFYLCSPSNAWTTKNGACVYQNRRGQGDDSVFGTLVASGGRKGWNNDTGGSGGSCQWPDGLSPLPNCSSSYGAPFATNTGACGDDGHTSDIIDSLLSITMLSTNSSMDFM